MATSPRPKLDLCDDSCKGTPHCDAIGCHQGHPELERCEWCDKEFCESHLFTVSETRACAACAVAYLTVDPISHEEARRILDVYDLPFKFQVLGGYTSAQQRTARIDRGTGIIYEGGSI